MSPMPPPSDPAPAAPAPETSSDIVWSDPGRESAFRGWIDNLAASQGLLTKTLRLASADASFRRYFRIDAASPDASGSASRIIMDAPPQQENSEPFVRIAGLMARAGLRVPEVLAWDRPQGFLLLSDLGTLTMMEVIDRDRPQANTALYSQAVDALITWQLASRPNVLPPYDRALLQRELALFPDWYLTKHRGVQLTEQQQGTLTSVFQQIVAHNLAAPSVYVHRDFMPRNLMASTLVMASATEGGIGILDFQDAVYGPITYDIASLMRDAFVSWEEDFVLDVTVRYWQEARKAGLLGATSASGWGDDFGEFYRAVEWMGLQRHLKVAGIFARLTLRDGKPRYLADAPRFIGYIRTTAGRYRELNPLMRLVDEVEGTQVMTGFAYGRV